MAKIEKLPSGNYRLRVVVGYADGKPIRKSFTHYDKAKLRLIAAEYTDKHRNAVRRLTVSQALDAFLASKQAVLSPSTMRAYKSMASTLKARHAALCAAYIDDIMPRDMQAFINDLVADGKTPKTVRNFHGLLSASVKFAGHTLPPATLPQMEKAVIHIPDEDMIKKILSAAKGTRLEIPLELAVIGLRRSEICALTLDDLNGSIIHIHNAKVQGLDKKETTKTTKTYSSDRYVRIPEDLAEKIRAQGYVTDYTLHAFSDAFDRLLRSNGLPHYRLHDLRHFFVSYCHNVLRLSDAQIQAITGHKTSAVMRSNYLHSMRDDKTAKLVADAISSL